jgi:4-amino-4-deoxy-L-arabinose transferase-like glycosyltransferase
VTTECSRAAGDRAFRIGLLAITAAAAAWRIGYLLIVKIDDELLLNDSLYYAFQATRNSDGDWFRENLSELPGAEHGPLTSLYLTPWSLLPGDFVAWQRVGMTLLGIPTVALVGVAGLRLAGPRVGLLAAGIAGVYPNLWINDSLVMSETVALLIVTAALVVALDFDRAPSAGRAVALGVLVGLGALTRTEIGLFAVGFAVLAWWRAAGHRRRALLPVLVVAASVLTVAPWAAYNLARFTEPVLLTTNDGTTLLGANCDSTYYVDVGGWDIRCLPPGGGEVEGSVRSRARRAAAVAYARDHVSRLPVVAAARLGRTLDLYGLRSLVAGDRGEEKAVWAVWAGIVMWWVLAVAAIVGWVDLRRRRVAARWWLVVPLASVLVTTILFYGAHRIRAPAEPVVVLLGAVGLLAMWDRARA